MKIRGLSFVVCLGLLCLSAAHGQQYTIQTLAGNGFAGYVGDGGDPAASQLSSPNAVALDSKGNIYIADTGNHRIRMISGGTITTIAGNGTAGYSGDGAAATAAELNSPSGLAFDSSGNLYIADTEEQRDPQDHRRHHHHRGRRQHDRLPVMAATGARPRRRFSTARRPSLSIPRATCTSRTTETT